MTSVIPVMYMSLLILFLLCYSVVYVQYTHTHTHTLTHKANMVFDGMNATRNFSGYVIFLEEDHYLSPDFLYMTEKLIEMKN